MRVVIKRGRHVHLLDQYKCLGSEKLHVVIGEGRLVYLLDQVSGEKTYGSGDERR